jgi:signal transduction histidine kinase
VALWVTLTALATLEGALQSAAWWDLALGVLGLGAAVAVSRTHPLPPLFIAAAFNLAYALDVINRGVPGRPEPFPLGFLAALLVFSYLAGRRMAYARPVVVCFAVLVAVPLPVILAATISADNVADAGLSMARWFTMIINLLLCGVFPWLVGRYRRQHDELVSAGWQRAEQLERQQRIATEQARLRERSRIAHDMHDSLGHELSLIAVRAAGLEVATDLEERHRRSARELREAAAQATDSLRQVIRVLRDDAESAPTEPAHESVSHLVERVRDSGVAVRLHVSGTPSPLPLMADRAAYSVVREALTNAAKHAPGSGVDVRLEHAAHETVITVTNTAATPAISGSDPGGAREAGTTRNAGCARDANGGGGDGDGGAGDNGGGTGLGLVGLAERVRLAGGTLRTGRFGDGAGGSGAEAGGGVAELGFEVVARIPHQSPVPADPPGPGHDGRDDRSESARHLDAVRRRARRGLITAIAVPVTLTAVVSVIMFGVYIYATANAVLPPGDFADLRVGQSRADVKRHLPRWDDIDPAPQRFPAAPSGASCEYFRAHGNLFTPADNYRLCFARGRLVTKDAVAPDTDPDTDPDTGPETGPPTTSGSPPR